MVDDPPITIFISYGRRDGSAFADRLAADLEQADFTVWRDTEQLESPHPWDAQLAAAIKGCDVVVALLSPHSVRTAQGPASDGNDSVCLDELAFARFSPPPTPIIPILIAPCEPPFVIYRLQYIDFLAAQQRASGYRPAFDRLVETIRALKAGVPIPYRVTRYEPIDFDVYLRVKTRDFVGREWLANDVFEALGTLGDQPGLLLIGEPGWGKTAFAAHLFGANPDGRLLAAHFCRFDRAETLDPQRFIESIAGMIATRVPAFAAELTKLGDRQETLFAKGQFNDAFELMVLNPLARLDSSTLGEVPRTILVDALDESIGSEDASIARLLGETSQLFPTWLKLVATSRDRSDVLSFFGAAEIIRLDHNDVRNTNDIAGLVAAVLASKDASVPSSAPESLVALVSSKAAGNALCATQLALAVKRSGMNADALAMLPRGLNALYRAVLQRRMDPKGLDWPQVREVFEMVMATSAPLPIGLAALAREDRSGYATRAAVAIVADLLVDHDDTIRLFHATFAEFVADPGTPYHVNPALGASRLARVALTDRNRLQLSAALSTFCDKQLRTWLLRSDDLATLSASLPAFYERTEFGRPAGGVSMYVNGVAIEPDEERLALRLAAVAPDVAFEIIRAALVRGGERFKDSGALPWMQQLDFPRPTNAESRAIGAGIEIAFDIAKLALGWVRAIGKANPTLRPRLKATMKDGAILRGCFGWLDIAVGYYVLNLSGYFEDQACALRMDWDQIEKDLC